MLVRAVIKHGDFGDGESTAIRLTGRTGPYPRSLHYAVVYSPHKCLHQSSFYRQFRLLLTVNAARDILEA